MSTHDGVPGTLDHFMIGSSDLLKTVQSFHQVTGVLPVFGGNHPSMGTHNYLVGLGDVGYLEFIGANPDGPVPDIGLPFGLDSATGTGFLTWAVSVPDLAAAHTHASARGIPMGDIMEGRREKPEGGVLSWRLSTPQPAPSNIIPFLIHWDQDPEVNRGEGSGATLRSVEIFHPRVEDVEAQLRFLGIDFALLPGPADVVPTIETVRGTFVLDSRFWEKL